MKRDSMQCVRGLRNRPLKSPAVHAWRSYIPQTHVDTAIVAVIWDIFWIFTTLVLLAHFRASKSVLVHEYPSAELGTARS